MTNQGQYRLTEILQKISELAQKAVGDDYLYRGEPECYERVSSSLYRKYPEIDAEILRHRLSKRKSSKMPRGLSVKLMNDAILDNFSISVTPPIKSTSLQTTTLRSSLPVTANWKRTGGSFSWTKLAEAT